MMWSVAALPLLAGPQVTGVIVEKEGKYTGMAVFSGVSIILGSSITFAPVFWRRIKRERESRKEMKALNEQS